jgi:MFS family permease
MFSVGLAWLVYRLTGSSLAVGITLTMQVTPALVFGIVAGPAADLVDRRRLLVTCDVLRAIIVLVLGVAAWLGKIPLPAVYVATFLLFSASCFYEPTLGATIPRLVGMSALTRANALASMGREVSDMTGRALGGFVVQLYGASVAFFGDALSFLLAALATIGALRGQIAPRSTSPRRISLAWGGASLAPLVKRRLGGLSLPLATGLYSLLLPLAGVVNTPLVKALARLRARPAARVAR